MITLIALTTKTMTMNAEDNDDNADEHNDNKNDAIMSWLILPIIKLTYLSFLFPAIGGRSLRASVPRQGAKNIRKSSIFKISWSCNFCTHKPDLDVHKSFSMNFSGAPGLNHINLDISKPIVTGGY